jgi:hypothetical protein
MRQKVSKAIAGAVVTGAVGGIGGGATILELIPPEVQATMPWWAFPLVYATGVLAGAVVGFAGVWVAPANKPA